MKVAIWYSYRVLYRVLVLVVFVGPAFTMVIVGDWLLPRTSKDVVMGAIYLPLCFLYVAIYRWIPPIVDRVDRRMESLKPTRQNQ